MGCLIRIEPEELGATAATLRGAAVELSQLGGDVHASCVSCCAPAAATELVLAGASAIRSSLDLVSGDLADQAGELDQRAARAAQDALPTARSAGSVLATADTGTMTVGGLPAGMTLQQLSDEGAPVLMEGSGGMNLAELAAEGDRLMAQALPHWPRRRGRRMSPTRSLPLRCGRSTT